MRGLFRPLSPRRVGAALARRGRGGGLGLGTLLGGVAALLLLAAPAKAPTPPKPAEPDPEPESDRAPRALPEPATVHLHGLPVREREPGRR